MERLLRGAAHERELLRPRVAHQRVAAAGTATSAAAEIGITQSALSQQLLDLAQRLAERLFERTGRRMVPTAFGAQFLERPRPPLDEMAQLRAWLLERRHAASGPIRISVDNVLTLLAAGSAGAVPRAASGDPAEDPAQ